MTDLPAAMVEMIVQFFGRGPQPSYGKAFEIIERDPYRRVRERFNADWGAYDFTDHNSDVASVVNLPGHPRRLAVRLSIVGSYAYVNDYGGRAVDDPEIAGTLAAEGFLVLPRELLMRPVPLWEPEFPVTVWELLFQFDEEPPWEALARFADDETGTTGTGPA
ncbi:hypothetical protein ACGIF2_14900 [Cellulomonas sp. P22]|uniref:hypothetical protein n=1 Tax=Cellulomonas sp. P22 TaxID=3373189 RepID=UPI0037B47037